ncbi:LemA family protein [Alloprevotella rava]|nr:LemA family protein [Alloprevotella rava]
MKSISVLPKSMIVLLSFLAIIGLGLLWGVGVRNGLVQEDENVSTAWANVQTQYQRRADLIPNLVNTVKGYAKHEEQTFKEVVEARAKATQITVNPENLTPEKLKEYQAAQGELGSALGKLIAVSENYPQLKANENFMELQAQLEGTENRINESRKRYNESVQSYNLKVRTFPANLVAGLCGFQTKNKFEAEAAAQNAPKVEF